MFLQKVKVGHHLIYGEAMRQAYVNEQLNEFDGSRMHFLRPDGSPKKPGEWIVQDDLAKVLQEQEDLMTANADALIKAAQLQYEKNASDENYIALLDAKAEKEGILAQVEGFRSEQLTNQISLQKELTEAAKEEAEVQLEIQKEKQQAIQDTLDATIDAAGAETKIGKNKNTIKCL